jgi:hypothetical protein
MIGTGNPVVDAIDSVTGNDGRLRLAMLVGAHMESGWNAGDVGDNGHSFGPFQINFPSHPGVTSAQATNPTWAATYMRPQYAAGVARVPDTMWASDPKHAAALAAYYAERPAQMYNQRAIDAAWTAVQQLAGSTGDGLPQGGVGAGASVGGGTAPGTGQSGGAAPVSTFNPVGWLAGSIAKDIGPLVLTGLFLLGGIGLVVLGAWRSAQTEVAR